MAIRNHFSEGDIGCIVVDNFSPTSADATVLVPFSFDVNIVGGTASSVEVSWGDGSSDPAVAGVSPSYSVSHTYATAGSYLMKVVTVLTTGETDETWQIITVV
jgi:hypothetical protein